jgi:hypothetical protein
MSLLSLNSAQTVTFRRFVSCLERPRRVRRAALSVRCLPAGIAGSLYFILESGTTGRLLVRERHTQMGIAVSKVKRFAEVIVSR